MRTSILFLDTNILLDCPRPEDYRLPGRPITLVVIPEVLQELRGLARSRDRERVGAAMQALALLEPLSRRPGSGTGVPIDKAGSSVRILPGRPENGVSTDHQLVLRAKAEQRRQTGVLVVVITRDRGVAEYARTEGVKNVLIRGVAGPSELERGLAEHDTVLDIDL